MSNTLRALLSENVLNANKLRICRERSLSSKLRYIKYYVIYDRHCIARTCSLLQIDRYPSLEIMIQEHHALIRRSRPNHMIDQSVVLPLAGGLREPRKKRIG